MATRTALITGASSGIGTAFAELLAADGHDLVLVARSADRLNSLADRLRAAHGVHADVLVADLAQPDAAARVATELDARRHTIDMLVNNAGFGSSGRFENISAAHEHDQLMVNIVALVDLCHELIPGMVRRGSGDVINVASTAGFQPGPYYSTYSAGKTFVLNFSMALRAEYRGRGVRVMALCPGPTQTAFFEVNDVAPIGGKMQSPAQVAEAGLRALRRDRAYTVPGLGNKLMAHLTPRRPRRMVAAMAKMVTRGAADHTGARDAAQPARR